VIPIDFGAAQPRKMNDSESFRLINVPEQYVIGRSFSPRKGSDSSTVKQMALR
jgi:hypothetical protein